MPLALLFLCSALWASATFANPTYFLFLRVGNAVTTNPAAARAWRPKWWRSDIAEKEGAPISRRRKALIAPDVITLLSMQQPSLKQFASQPIRGSRLAVVEPLWAVAVANGLAIEFYDLHVAPVIEEMPRPLSFLCSARLDAPVSELQLCPHDASLLAAGTGSGDVVCLRLRRPGQSGELLCRPTLRRSIAPAGEGVVDVIRFHPLQPALCAVVCSGEVHLLHHGPGLLLSSRPICAGPSPATTVAWCGSILARGEADGGVSLWRLEVGAADPRSPSLDLSVVASQVATLPSPLPAPPPQLHDTALPLPARLCSLRWLPSDGGGSETGARGEGMPGETALPLGVLCCGHAEPATFRAWRVPADGGPPSLMASLPAAPLKGATSLSCISEALCPLEPTQVALASDGGELSGPAGGAHPFVCTHPRWLLCAALGAAHVFALPWGQDAKEPQAALRFPTATELLRVPSLHLEPAPREGVLAVHRINSAACRDHLASALDLSGEARLMGQGGPAPACASPPATVSELMLVLSDQGVHVLAQLTHSGTALDRRAELSAPLPTAPPQAAPMPPPPPAPVLHQPLVSHLLPLAARRATAANAAASYEGVDGAKHAGGEHGKDGGRHAGREGGCGVPAQQAGGQAAEAEAGKPSGGAPASEAAVLLARIASLETRAVSAEERLEELRTSFGMYAAHSRKTTNTLLAALDRLQSQQRAQQAVEGSSDMRG